jgi:hypothetical protein
MKKVSFKNSAAVLAIFLSIFTFGFKPAGVTPDKITICHMPPGNPSNCQEITISLQAFEAHMDHHDDALVCYEEDAYEFYQALAKKSELRLIKVIRF